MRKCSSAPDLPGLAERTTGTGHQTRTSGPRTTGAQQTSRLRIRGPDNASKIPGTDSGNRLGSSLCRRSPATHSPTAAKAFFGLTAPIMSPDLLREADEMAEVSNLKGITAAECFEIYGVPEEAPPIAGSHAKHPVSQADQEGLASCLATPSTMTEEVSLGETLDRHLRESSAEQTRQVQARMQGELRPASEAEIGNTNAKLPGKHQSNRRRRSWEDMFATAFGEDGPTYFRPPSPDGHAYLSSLHGSIDDDRNRIHVTVPARSQDLAKPAFLVPSEQSTANGMSLLEADPHHVHAPAAAPSAAVPSNPVAMAHQSALYQPSPTSDSDKPLSAHHNDSSQASSPNGSSSPPENEPVSASDQGLHDGAHCSSLDDQQSASPQQTSPAKQWPADVSAQPMQQPAEPNSPDVASPAKRDTVDQPELPSPQRQAVHQKPRYRNNIVPLPFKIRDEHK